MTYQTIENTDGSWTVSRNGKAVLTVATQADAATAVAALKANLPAGFVGLDVHTELAMYTNVAIY